MPSNPSHLDVNVFTAYLEKHGINEYKQRGNEISFPCPFGCDDDHRDNEEYHMSFACDKCVWHCFKCGQSGNFITLLKHYGDNYHDYIKS